MQYIEIIPFDIKELESHPSRGSWQLQIEQLIGTIGSHVVYNQRLMAIIFGFQHEALFSNPLAAPSLFA